MFPFTDTAPRAAFPAIVLLLIAVNALVLLITLSLPLDLLHAVLVQYALIPLRYTQPDLARAVGRVRDHIQPAERIERRRRQQIVAQLARHGVAAAARVPRPLAVVPAMPQDRHAA